MKEISQEANVVNVVPNENSVLIFFFVLPSAPISPRIQLKSSKWNWLMRVECLGKEGSPLCPAWAKDTEGRSQLWKQEDMGFKGNRGEGKAYGREDCFSRKNASPTRLGGDLPEPLWVHGRGLLTRDKETARYSSSKDGFFQDQQRIAIQGLQLWWATCKLPRQQGRESTFIEGVRKVGRAVGNKETIEFSLAEFLPGMKSLSARCWALLLLQGMRAALLVTQLYLIFINLYRT